jgi:ABC-type nitrate/sulfonate/bicarbonate transport system substrate-binding protein
MHTIDLAYVGRGLHEELVAYIADQEDYYAAEGVHVALRDGCAWDEERLRRGATIGLGRALLSRLTGGIPWVALNVNTDRPLFWFLARPGLTSLADLAGRRLAVHAPHTAPGCFARIVLRQAGLDPDRDLDTVVRPPGDYGLDLRGLHDGTIDAAFVGSTMAPEAVAAEHGWQVLAWVGDHFRIPTVGVAVDPTYVHPDDPAVQAVVRAHRRALEVVRKDPETTVRHLHAFLGRHTVEEVRAHYETFIAPYFTTDGRADLAVGDTAITAVAAELGVPVGVTAAEFYRTAAVGSD